MKWIVGVSLCLCLVSWNASVALADSGGCNSRTVKGRFGTLISGTVTFPDGTSFPAAEVGLFKLDGVKNVSGSDTLSFNGNVFARTFSGTYTVAADCTTTVVLTNLDDGSEGTTSGVIVDDGNTVLLISTNPGDTSSGRATRVSDSSRDWH